VYHGQVSELAVDVSFYLLHISEERLQIKDDVKMSNFLDTDRKETFQFKPAIIDFSKLIQFYKLKLAKSLTCCLIVSLSLAVSWTQLKNTGSHNRKERKLFHSDVRCTYI